uniref:Domain of unknown function DB domain-containing protein n=1 Tax=Acrobeloides nanus TaxID=290746 RepID=A0A914DWZ6_9BILA
MKQTMLSSIAALAAVLLYCEGRSSDNLPSCDAIPKLLCCTDRVLEKCLAGCTDYVSEKCSHKLNKFSQASSYKRKQPSSTSVENTSKETEKVSPVRAEADDDLIPLPNLPKPQREEPRRARQHAAARVQQPTGNKARNLADLPQEGFIEQKPPVGSGHATSSRVSQSIPRSGGDYDLLNSKYPVTEVSDADLKKDCGTALSHPPFAPCLPRNTVDELFLSCCQQHVPSNCHSLCTYEHRENVAAETLIAAVQQDNCDLKYLSALLYCANQNRDNRKCCEHLGLSNPELGVGDRCLRMCNIARSGNTLGTVEKNDLVCLSNWNVLMYCARSGLRTIN